ncbi:hypothetical protein [Thalassotalea sediminis]|nr:hypothetical protein [Thalassotalea sediminis]
MMYKEDSKMPEVIDERSVENQSVEQQLIDAKKEIEDLKSQLMWLERSYE